MFEQALCGLGDAEREQMSATLNRIRNNLNDIPEDKEANHG
jgi:DNA-binding MarR family transcriptional regulator